MNDQKLFQKVRELYDYRDGNLYYKRRLGRRGKVGSKVGYFDDRYYKTSIYRKKYFLHRLIFLWHKGYMPKTCDHINGDKTDNRIENLREVTLSQNNHNRRINKNSTSGVKGVSWNKRLCKWEASIKCNCKKYYLGRFDDIKEASRQVKKVREELHGKYAHHG